MQSLEIGFASYKFHPVRLDLVPNKWLHSVVTGLAWYWSMTMSALCWLPPPSIHLEAMLTLLIGRLSYLDVISSCVSLACPDMVNQGRG